MSIRKYIIGFTVIELMITIALGAVLLTIGVPSFTSLLRQNTIITQTNTVLSSLFYARNETITENTIVSIEPLVSGANWTEGWEIYLDGSSTPSRIFEGINNATLVISNGVSSITYLPDGRISNANPIVLTLTPSNCPTGDTDIRIFTIGLSGQVTTTQSACP